MVCHDAWVQLEEVEFANRRVAKVATETCNVDLTRSVQVKEPRKLLIQSVSNNNATTVFKFNFQVLDCDL